MTFPTSLVYSLLSVLLLQLSNMWCLYGIPCREIFVVSNLVPNVSRHNTDKFNSLTVQFQ